VSHELRNAVDGNRGWAHMLAPSDYRRTERGTRLRSSSAARSRAAALDRGLARRVTHRVEPFAHQP
jgi:hypothetical protein